MPVSPVSKEQADPSSTFYAEFKEFRTKYPMCYLEAWTPEDFDVDGNGEPKEEVDWNERRWRRIAARLGHEFDASIGTNWDRVGEVAQRLSGGR